MARFYGKIGYAVTEETTPGVWVEVITERPYYGELVRNTRNLHASEILNVDVMISNGISIVADPYDNQNFHAMRYVEFMGTKWKVRSVDVKYPRLVLNIGGVYNGN